MSPLAAAVAAVVLAVLVLLAAAVVVQTVRLGRCRRRCEDLTLAYGRLPRPVRERRYLVQPPPDLPATAHRRPIQGRAAVGRHSAPQVDHKAGDLGWPVLAPDAVELYRKEHS